MNLFKSQASKKADRQIQEYATKVTDELLLQHNIPISPKELRNDVFGPYVTLSCFTGLVPSKVAGTIAAFLNGLN